MSIIYEALLELHADQITNESLKRFERKRIYQLIDEALQKGDQQAFINLTNQLKALG